MAFESWYKSILWAKLNPWDTTLKVATPPTITQGRVYLKSWAQEEWISFAGVDGNTLTWLERQLSRTSTPAVSEWDGYTWTAWTTIRIVAMHDQITWWNMDTTNFAPSEWGGEAITFNGTTYTREITPTEDFSLECWTVVAGMTYILIIHTTSSFAMTLWMWITNPYGENLELTNNKDTVVVLLATWNNAMQVWAVRTAI